MLVAVVPWEREPRFCGETNTAVAHVFTLTQMQAWCASKAHEGFTMACGAMFRPSWAGTTSVDAICPDCWEAVAAIAQVVEVPE